MSSLTRMGIYLAEHGWLSDRLLRSSMRRLCQKRLRHVSSAAAKSGQGHETTEPTIAVETEAANEQHYELPESFFGHILGDLRKYSCCYWGPQTTDLDDAETDALQRTCEHAQLEDGMRVLDLGCGWGSMTRWIADQYPNCTIEAVSNSHSQREMIEQVVRARGWQDRVQVITADINDFSPDGQFDRIVSVEMLEHVRHHEPLFRRMSSWLHPAGKLMAHVFTHRQYSYPFETEGADNWMGRYFFTGGIMPSENLLVETASGFSLEEKWTWNGQHYQKTADAWLDKMDAARPAIDELFNSHYGDQGRVWWHRWRMFLLAVSELFGYDDGRQWQVNHYRFALSP